MPFKTEFIATITRTNSKPNAETGEIRAYYNGTKLDGGDEFSLRLTRSDMWKGDGEYYCVGNLTLREYPNRTVLEFTPETLALAPKAADIMAAAMAEIRKNAVGGK